MNHCVERITRKYGAGRRPTLRQIEKEGYAWARRGIDTQRAAVEYLKAHVQRCVVKSKTVQPGSVELNLEVRLREAETDFINELASQKGVASAVLVSYNGDYMG